MAYVNWRDPSLPILPRIQLGQHPTLERRADIGLNAEGFRALLPLLEASLLGDEGELRMDLPENWLFFWKRREGEGRLLLAHPQPNEWVATVALNEEHARALLKALGETLAQGSGSVALSELGSVSSFSNLEVVLTLS